MDQQQQDYPSHTTPGRRQAAHVVTERELPMLAGIGAIVTWFEDLLNILSGPVITAGLVIALVALLTDGDLLVKVPAMLYIWSVSMALGLDAQFVGSAAKMARAARQRKWLAVVGYGVLCAALGYVGYIASNVFATQEAEGITTAQALQHLGMDGSTWILQRSLLAVVLVFLSGYLRYVAPGKNVAASVAEEAERLRAEIELAPLRAQAQAAKIRNARGAVMTALGREQQSQQQRPTVTPGKPRIVAAGYASPPTQPPQEHLAYDAYRAMHDGYDDDILDETEDNGDLFSTLTIPAVRLDGGAPSGPATDETSHGAGSRKTSGVRGRNRAASNASKKGNSKVKSEAKALRRAAIRDTVYTILDEWHAAGRPAGLSDRELARRVAERVSFAVNPSGNTVARWRGPWQSSRAHKAALELEAEGAIVSAETMAELESLEPALP